MSRDKLYFKKNKFFSFFFKNPLHSTKIYCIIAFVIEIGLSPNGKALDSDSSISRFESL